MKIEDVYLQEYTRASCLIQVDGKYYRLTAEGIVKYGQQVKLND